MLAVQWRQATRQVQAKQGCVCGSTGKVLSFNQCLHARATMILQWHARTHLTPVLLPQHPPDPPGGAACHSHRPAAACRPAPPYYGCGCAAARPHTSRPRLAGHGPADRAPVGRGPGDRDPAPALGSGTDPGRRSSMAPGRVGRLARDGRRLRPRPRAVSGSRDVGGCSSSSSCSSSIGG